MMRVPTHARVWMAMTTSLGLGVVVLATVRGAMAPLTTLALLAAAALLAELFQVDGDERSLDPRDAHSSSFSTGVHFAAVLIVGPWAAAVVAAFGVLFVDRMRGASWSKLAFNASNFALATFAGGQAFQLAGGVPGVLDLPAKLGAVAVLAGVYGAVNAILIGGIIAFTSGRRISRTIFGAFRSELPTTIAEVGLGVLVAVCALKSPWAVAALVPLLIADYQARYRLAMLRRETARALETFANVVDERDPYTFDHSARVGEYVRRLAKALGLPATDVFRLHWAGRL